MFTKLGLLFLLVWNTEALASPAFWSPYPEVRVSQEEAIHYCSIRKMRAPTAREVAMVAINHGARGFVLSPQSNVIRTREVNGTRDYFNFDSTGFSVGNSSGTDFFWTSSSLNLEGSSHGMGYIYYAKNERMPSALVLFSKDSLATVLCIRKRGGN